MDKFSIFKHLEAHQKRKRERQAEYEAEEDEVDDRRRKRARTATANQQADLISVMSAEVVNLMTEKNARKPRAQDEDRIEDKKWWANNPNWSAKQFKKRMRIERPTFEYLLSVIAPKLQRKPTPPATRPHTLPPCKGMHEGARRLQCVFISIRLGCFSIHKIFIKY